MAIILECEHGHKLRVRNELAGKKVRCPKCQAIVHVDAGGESQDQAANPTLPFRPKRSPRSKKRTERKTSSGWPAGVVVAFVGAAVLLVALGIVLMYRQHESAPSANSADVQTLGAAPSTTSDRVATQVAAANEEPESRTAAAVKPPHAVPPQSDRQSTTRVTEPKRLAIVDPGLKSPGAATSPIGIGPRQAPVSKSRVVVWDAAEAGLPHGEAEGSQSGRDGWEQLTIETAAAHHFHGDCIIENESLLIRLPRGALLGAIIVPKVGLGRQATVPISVLGRGAASVDAKSIRVSAISADSATIEFEPQQSRGNGPKVACRLDAGKYWIELKPVAMADQVIVGVKSQFVIVPSEFGEDLICDSMVSGDRRSIPVPNETEVLALECEGNFMTVLSYPSIEQAGALTVATDPGARNHGAALSAYVDSMSAHFKGKSVFVAVLPHKDNWYYEVINKKYSASGQYPIPWQPPYAGVWRLAGRVSGRYFVSDVPSDRFVYACSMSGTLDCLFGYLNGPGETASAGPVTPLAIEREECERSKTAGNRIATADDGRELMHRKTRYRDVCNSVDDMKETWRNDPGELQNDPNHIRNLLDDCKAIVERLDRRLNEYRDLNEQVGTALVKMQQERKGKDDAGLESFAAAVQTQQGRLKGIKLIRATRGINAIDRILQKIQAAKAARPNVAELDRLAESVRDVANVQEVELKKLRAITLQLADVCSKRRKNTPPAVQPYLTLVGRHCRKVLRNRDPEE